MKCPNCGSTAQVKLILENEILRIYKCGCGTLIKEKIN